MLIVLVMIMIALVQNINCESIQVNDCCKLAKICNTASSVCANISICKDTLECIDSKAAFVKKYGSDQTLDLEDLDLNQNESDEYDSCDFDDSDDQYLDLDDNGQESEEFDGDYDYYDDEDYEDYDYYDDEEDYYDDDEDYEDCTYEDYQDWDQELGNNEHLEEFRTL